jgi:hypothetical protein
MKLTIARMGIQRREQEIADREFRDHQFRARPFHVPSEGMLIAKSDRPLTVPESPMLEAPARVRIRHQRREFASK